MNGGEAEMRDHQDRGGHEAGVSVLVVGDEQEAVAIRRALDEASFEGDCREVPGYLHALGELATRGPAQLLIGGMPSEGYGPVDVTAEALRELAPEATLLVMVAPGGEQQGELAVQAGFDGWTTSDGDLLTGLVRDLLGQSVGDTPGDEEVTPEGYRFVPEAGASIEDTDESGRASAEASDDTMVADEAESPGDSHESVTPDPVGSEAEPEVQAAAGQTASTEGEPDPAATPAVAPEEAGDVDLIRQLLTNPRGLPAMVSQIVQVQSGIEGIELALGDETVPAEHVTASVTFNGRSFGVLHVPGPADPEQLKPWADWAAHWLALQHSMVHLSQLALRDELTDLHNRRYFDQALARVLDRARMERFRVTLMIFDIDDFKRYNDLYGHPAGDEILRETAKLIRSSVRKHDIVARIGGDEFAVIFWDAETPRQPNSEHPQDVGQAAERFRAAVCAHRFPKLLEEAPGTLTISGGLASFPWDGRTPDELYELADQMLLESKRQGKNAITFGPGANRVCNGG